MKRRYPSVDLPLKQGISLAVSMLSGQIQTLQQCDDARTIKISAVDTSNKKQRILEHREWKKERK